MSSFFFLTNFEGAPDFYTAGTSGFATGTISAGSAFAAGTASAGSAFAGTASTIFEAAGFICSSAGFLGSIGYDAGILASSSFAIGSGTFYGTCAVTTGFGTTSISFGGADGAGIDGFGTISTAFGGASGATGFFGAAASAGAAANGYVGTTTPS